MVLTIVSERGGGGGALNEDSGVSIGGLDGSGGEVGGAERRKGISFHFYDKFDVDSGAIPMLTKTPVDRKWNCHKFTPVPSMQARACTQKGFSCVSRVRIPSRTTSHAAPNAWTIYIRAPNMYDRIENLCICPVTIILRESVIFRYFVYG